MPSRFQICDPAEPGWHTRRETVAFASPHVSVAVVEVASPARPEPRPWLVARRKAAAVVAPILADGRLLLVRQERIAVRHTIWEFPAGQIDATTEHDERLIRETALRELREETGHRLAPHGTLEPLGFFFSSPGFTDEHAYLFAARPVEPDPDGHAHDAEESIVACRAFTPAELWAMVASNDQRDANTLCALARLAARGLIPCPS